jgi:hypothetical protein
VITTHGEHGDPFANSPLYDLAEIYGPVSEWYSDLAPVAYRAEHLRWAARRLYRAAVKNDRNAAGHPCTECSAYLLGVAEEQRRDMRAVNALIRKITDDDRRPEGPSREDRLLAALEAIPPGAGGWRRASLYRLKDETGLVHLQQVMAVRDKLVKAGVIEYRVEVVNEGKRSRIGAWRIV